MKIAFISDVHANIYSLKEVMKDINYQDVDKIICLGDLVGYATHPNEVINYIRKEDILTIQGNYDESTGEELLFCGCDYDSEEKLERASKSLFWTQDNVTEENKKWLKELPKEKHLTIEGNDLYLVHGSPRKNNEYLFVDSDVIDEITKEYKFDIMLCGHTHLPYFKVINDKYIVNVGSAGKPKHGNPRVNYVILDIRENSIDFITREVSYDYEKIAREIEEEDGLPSVFARVFRTGNN